MDDTRILRTGSTCAGAISALALACLFSSPASAQLRQHVRLQAFVPTGAEAFTQDGELLDTRFGFDVAIRNGVAFICSTWIGSNEGACIGEANLYHLSPFEP